MPGHDDHDLERRLPEQRVEADDGVEADEDVGADEDVDEDVDAYEDEDVDADEDVDEDVDADEEMTLAEARWLLKVTLALALVVGVVAFSGVGRVPQALQGSVLGALEQARDSSTAAIRSAVGESVSRLGAVASKVGAVPKALGKDVVGALQQARDSSTAAIRSAVGKPAGQHLQNASYAPFHKQYHSKVFICLPNANVYVTRSVSARSVPSLVSRGAIYPVPAGGCS